MNSGNAHSKPARVMGFADVAMFYVVTGVSLRWIATAAAAGPSSVLVWIAAFLFFYLPLAAAVIELSSRYPEEGGLYIWTRKAYGDFPAFMAGWCYWTSNLPYFPAAFYFAASNALYMGSAHWHIAGASPAYFMGFAFLSMAFITALNIVGLNVAKWLSNIGAVGMWLPVLVLVVLGLIVYTRFGSATHFNHSSMMPVFHLKEMIFWASLTFAYCGCETASFMGDEIKDARKTIPRALIFAGLLVTFCYIAGTIAVLVALPPDKIDTLAGLMQAATVMLDKLGWLWLAPVLAFFIAIGNLGAAGGYLAATARIPFVVGIDKMLPPAFGTLHPRFGTPHVAILTQAGLGVVFIVLGQAGTSVKGAYDVLVSMSIIATFIPFIFVFSSLIKLQGEPVSADVVRIPGGKPVAVLLACVGLTMTVIAIVLATLPAAYETNKALAVVKIIGLSGLLLGIGWAIYARETR